METKSTQKGGTLCIPAAAVLDASREAAGKAHVLSRNSLHFCCHRRRNTRLDGPYTWPRQAFLLLLHQEGMVQVVLTCSVRINYLRLRSAKPVQKKTKSVLDCFPARCATEWRVGTGSHWVRKEKDTEQDTEVILPTSSILSENAPFPAPENSVSLFRRTQAFQGATAWEGAELRALSAFRLFFSSGRGVLF